MLTHLILPSPYGEEAAEKEVFFAVATAAAKRERLLRLRHGACANHIVAAVRHILTVLRKEGRVLCFMTAGRFDEDSPAAAYLFDKYPEAKELLLEEGVTLVLLA